MGVGVGAGFPVEPYPTYLPGIQFILGSKRERERGGGGAKAGNPPDSKCFPPPPPQWNSHAHKTHFPPLCHTNIIFPPLLSLNSFLLDKGSFPALVNNEGDTPLELAEDYDEIIDMIQEKIDQDLIDVNAVKGVEESIMLEDANRLKNDCTLVQVVSHGGATPLHIAAAKEYTQVMR